MSSTWVNALTAVVKLNGGVMRWRDAVSVSSWRRAEFLLANQMEIDARGGDRDSSAALPDDDKVLLQNFIDENIWAIDIHPDVRPKVWLAAARYCNSQADAQASFHELLELAATSLDDNEKEQIRKDVPRTFVPRLCPPRRFRHFRVSYHISVYMS